jgi:hypothetical protein
LAQHGELRSKWEQKVDLLPLGRGEVENVTPPDSAWEVPETVLEFDT